MTKNHTPKKCLWCETSLPASARPQTRYHPECSKEKNRARARERNREKNGIKIATECSRCGGPMPKGISARQTLCGEECQKTNQKEYAKRYQENNKERISARNAASYQANREERLAKNKEYREANADRIREYRKEWYKENKEIQDARNKACREKRDPEEVRQYRRSYYEDNKEHLLELGRKWRENNPERHLANIRQYNAANTDRLREYRKSWREENIDKVREQNAQWKRENKEKVASYQQKRRALEAEAFVEYVDHLTVFERDNWTCHICGELIDPNAGGNDVMKASLDHVVPLNKGGEHSYDNCKASHLSCNAAKRDSL